jgi:hypothetical protein
MQQSQENTLKDARLLANDMAGLTRQLNLVYRQFETRAISKEGLGSEILKVLNNNYPETLAEPIINELEQRCQLRDKISRILTDNEFITLKSNQLVLDTNHRISVSQTIRQYYLDQLKKDEPAINTRYCAIFGLTEFISEHYEIVKRGFFSVENRNQSLIGMCYLSALHGNLEFLQKTWELAESFGIEKDLITNNKFSVVAASLASNNPQINAFIMACVRKVNLSADIPLFTDDIMFPLYAQANNRPALLACWKKGRTPQAYLALLTDNDCKVFNDIADTCEEETAHTLLNCLIALSKTSETPIQDDTWKIYFRIAVSKGTLSALMQIWSAIENEPLKKSLLNDAILAATDDFHIPALKFILEQAEHYNENPIDSSKLDYIEQMIPLGFRRIGELFAHSPLIKTLHAIKF